jgi:hypothetical protein
MYDLNYEYIIKIIRMLLELIRVLMLFLIQGIIFMYHILCCKIIYLFCKNPLIHNILIIRYLLN